MNFPRPYTRLCCFASLCILIGATQIGCGDADDNGSPTQAEKPVIVITNPRHAEAIIFAETNAVRARHGKSRLKEDRRLQQLARSYSELMLKDNFFDHVTPKGKTLSDRFEMASIRYRVIAENLARFEGNFETIPAHEVVEGWLGSPGHRVNLLDEKDRGFIHMGIGVAVGQSQSSSQPVYYYTQLFWAP